MKQRDFDAMFRNLMDLGTVAVRHPFFKDLKDCACEDDCDCGPDCSCNDTVEERVVGVLHASGKPVGDNYLVQAEVPGLKEEDLSVEFKENVLTIKAQYGKLSEDMTSLKYGLWKTAFKFKDADGDNISAKLENGILTVTLPKKAEMQPIKISINK